MYEKLEKKEGIKILARIMQTYGCMTQYKFLYTEVRINELWGRNIGMQNMVIFHRQNLNSEGITGFMDDYKDPNKIIIWANHVIGITNEEELRESLHDFYKCICDYSKLKGIKIFYAKKVLWKLHKPIWLDLISNWKEILTDVAREYFVDFEIDDNKIIEFIVK